MPPEVRRLGRTISRWRDQILAWHLSHVSNGPTEAVNNLGFFVYEMVDPQHIVADQPGPPHLHTPFSSPSDDSVGEVSIRLVGTIGPSPRPNLSRAVLRWVRCWPP